ncbi:MAG: SDR family NAD(P)-dependent oxidoreductase [bacterium]|nr:SDR family NAD(P)-dependent oxidoreductase [bacterium]
MRDRVLVTGGAGFIGSFLVDELVKKGKRVRVLDNFEAQVHQGRIPSYLNPHAELVRADVRDRGAVKKALTGVTHVVHLAARVGVGQANYQIRDYMDVNVGGMATLLDIIVNEKTDIEKIVMTASMTSYGEGMYSCRSHGKYKMHIRPEEQLKKRQWNFFCPKCRKKLDPVPTDEDTIFENKGIYALSKQTQEEMLFSIGSLYNIPAVSLRLFNVYGPRQSLSNPYTGVSAIFISRLRNNVSPVVFEDGLQSRDFVSVHDVIGAILLSMKKTSANFIPINIGSGIPTGIADLAKTLSRLLGMKIPPMVINEGRKGDIRHCFADISRAKKLLGWEPKISFHDGLKELVEWSLYQKPTDLFEKAVSELSSKKLLIKHDH